MEDKNLDISQKGLEKLLVKSLENFQEERDLALERYRRQDEAMVNNEDFMLQGKVAVDYLRTAADRSNAILAVAKMVKEIVYKESPGGGGNQAGGLGGGSLDDENKRQILKIIHENNT
jgi:hypothetical protein